MATVVPAVAPAQGVQSMVGEIIVVGDTRHEVWVRGRLGFFPGQKLNYPDLKSAETMLADSGLFKIDPETGARPTVQVLDNPGLSKDILIKVEDMPPTLIDLYACPALLAALVIAMTLLAIGAYWRYRRNCREDDS